MLEGALARYNKGLIYTEHLMETIRPPAEKKRVTAAVRTKKVVAADLAVSTRTPATAKKAAPSPTKKAMPSPIKKAAPAARQKKSAVKKDAATPEVRRNRRSDSTIQSILAATEEIILLSGAERVSILDVCVEAKISRGTFYRYFSSQDDLLDAFSRHKRDRFHATLAEATGQYDDPDERFQAVIQFIDDYLESSRARRLLVVAPDYAMRWFQRIFHDSVIRFQDVLSIVFDAWETRLCVSLDRELMCELMVRYILSDVLVPAGPDRRNMPRRIERLMAMLLSGRVARR